MATYKLDGHSHAVYPGDVLLMEGPGRWMGKTSGVIDLGPRDTITMLLGDDLAPGEAVTIIRGMRTTTFFRPAELSEEINRDGTFMLWWSRTTVEGA